MIDHTGIRSSNIERSVQFYKRALAPLGYVVCRRLVQAVGFGVPTGHGRSLDPGGDFWVAAGEALVPRSHIAFSASDRATVDAFYAAALAVGGRVNGAPGLRTQYHSQYYAAFVFDPDGYNVEAVYHGNPPA